MSGSAAHLKRLCSAASPRRRAVTIGLCLALLSSVGCEDVQLGWGAGDPKPRPAGPPVGRSADSSASDANAGTTGQGTRHGGGQAAPTRGRGDASSSLLGVYQLVLLSEPAPTMAPPGLKHVRLSRAKARDVANLLMVLYPPAGPSGTDHRYTLVYPTPLEQELAGETAVLLDVAAADEPAENATETDIWHWSISEAFVAMDYSVVPEPRRRQLARRLLQVVASAELSRTQRWVAAMLAGETLSNRLYDNAAGERAYEQAQAVAEAGSYEQMSASFARSRACYQDGRRDRARQLCETIIAQFGAMRGCEVYQRARESLAAWEKVRR